MVRKEIEELRDYNPDGTPKTRYWLGEDDKWWDWSFYFHCFILIGVWMLLSVVTTGYLTKAQFVLNHTITVFWAFSAGIYSFTVIIIDVVDALKRRQ